MLRNPRYGVPEWSTHDGPMIVEVKELEGDILHSPDLPPPLYVHLQNIALPDKSLAQYIKDWWNPPSLVHMYRHLQTTYFNRIVAKKEYQESSYASARECASNRQ
jgi:hypothetical protein